jgi:hypothetical protein
MGRIGLLGALAVLLLPFGGAASRPLPLTALPPATAPLTGLVYESGAYRLVQVDPATLGVARTSAPLAQGYGWARSPDGGMLVLGTGVKDSYETTALQFADPATLELVGKPVTFSHRRARSCAPTSPRRSRPCCSAKAPSPAAAAATA